MGPVHFGDQPRKNYKTHSDEITVSFYTDLKKARISQKLHYERSPLCVKIQIQYFRCHDQIVWICIDSILYRNNFKYTYSLILIESLVSHPSLSDLQYLITDDSIKKKCILSVYVSASVSLRIVTPQFSLRWVATITAGELWPFMVTAHAAEWAGFQRRVLWLPPLCCCGNVLSQPQKFPPPSQCFIRVTDSH